MSLSSPMQVSFDTPGGHHLSPYRVPAGTPARHLCASTWGDRAQAAEAMRFCAPPATPWVLTLDASETPAVLAVIKEGHIGVPTASHWRPVCVSWETPPGTPAQASPQRAPGVTPEQHTRSAGETSGGHARDFEKLTATSRRLISVPVASRECPDELPQRHGGDAVSRLSHGAGKPDCTPLSKPVGGHRDPAADSRRSETGTAGGVPPERCCCDGRCRGVIGPLWSHGGEQREKARRGVGPACSERARTGLLLEEDDNGPMTLELLAVSDGLLVATVESRFFRCVHGGAPRAHRASARRETEHSPGPERASSTQCRTPASDAVHKVLARCRGSTGAR